MKFDLSRDQIVGRECPHVGPDLDLTNSEFRRVKF